MRRPTFALPFFCLLLGCTPDKSGELPVSPAAPPAAYPASDSPAPQKPSASGPKVHRTFSGLEYEVIREGTGRRPTMFNSVKVHYHGYLPGGKVFDSSVQRGRPAVFPLNRVIAGWTEGIQLMREGAKYRFTIPPDLAYGKQGSPPTIGPDQTLIFEVELLEVLY